MYPTRRDPTGVNSRPAGDVVEDVSVWPCTAPRAHDLVREASDRRSLEEPPSLWADQFNGDQVQGCRDANPYRDVRDKGNLRFEVKSGNLHTFTWVG